ncbi:MAG TPA: NAD(P) transhydrogenase subunit alpha [Trueperaceae bacterium]|nr:NAD(P) transhydrogenase subunit alpha [Trueperaceae bacterium]
MNVVALTETVPGERRVAVTPQSAAKLVALGAEVAVESGLGTSIFRADTEYAAAGVKVGARAGLLPTADLLLAVQPPAPDIVAALKPGAMLASFLDPFFNHDLVTNLMTAGISALCMELIPRTTYAQKMDALSSQASLGGYAAVMMAAQRSIKAFPMMSTPAGTIAPARVFVVGAGVAGLQAIATAKRLGARVEAYDTRPVVKEQVQSLGARFVEIDVGETGQTEQGYAKELSEEQLARQREQMAKICAGADVIITTAQVFGRSAPRIISAAMVAGMKPGSVIVDMAASTGGNVEGTEAGRDVITVNGVTIVGPGNLPAEVALDASQMYANNLYLLVEHAWNSATSSVDLDTSDNVIGPCLLTHGGVIRDERVRAAVEGSPERTA